MVTAILCLALYLGLLITLHLLQPPVAPITWQVELSGNDYGGTIHPSPAGGMVLVTSENVVFIDAMGEVIREQHLAGANLGRGEMDISGNTYVGGDAGFVYAYGPDGEENWVIQLPDKSLVSPPQQSRTTRCSIDRNGNVIVQVNSGELALLSQNGEVLQHTAFPYSFSSGISPVRINESQFAVVRSGQRTSNELAAVDLSGNEVWRQTTQAYSIDSIDLSGDVLIVHTRHDGIFSYSLDGDSLWSFHNPDPQGAHTYHRYEGVETFGDELYYFSGSTLFSLAPDGKINWQLPNDGVAIPLFSDATSLLFAQYTIPNNSNKLRDLINRYSPIGLGYQHKDRHVDLVEVVDQAITQSWKLPDNLYIATGLGKDGEVYGYTMGDSYRNIPIKIYRFDL